MLRLLLAFFASLMLVACATSTTTAPDAGTTRFRAMTCNVRYGTANDGINAWPERRETLALILDTAAPHVLGVQEALAFQVAFLAKRLPHHRVLGEGRDGGERGEYSALFIDERMFAVLDHGQFWLSDTPTVIGSVGWDAALPRICTWARLQSRATGRELHVWNTHFDHRGRNARHEGARLIARRVANTPGPHLVLGDLNAGEQSAPLTALRAVQLRDTFRDVHPDATEVGTFHDFRGGTEGQKIDYVLASDGLTTLAAEILTAPGENGRWPSDHHLVTAELEF